MLIENIPDLFVTGVKNPPGISVHDFRMTTDQVKSKVNLRMHMFSFLQEGKKQVHFAETSVAVNRNQSLLTRKGNCLWTELPDNSNIYYCKLLFFSEKKLNRFLKEHCDSKKDIPGDEPFFVIENDEYISSYINSLSVIGNDAIIKNEDFLYIKFEEIMLYLIKKYGNRFKAYLQSLAVQKDSRFKEIVERNVYSNLKVEEIAFLCNMSLSTFKRHFRDEYKVSPGKWLHDKRLEKARILLTEHHVKASDIYLEIGYNNLSNFSTAFKNKFGFSPKEVSQATNPHPFPDVTRFHK